MTIGGQASHAEIRGQMESQREHLETMAAASWEPRLRALLIEARAALGPEFCGYAGSLAERIDDVIQGASTPDFVKRDTASGRFFYLACTECGHLHWTGHEYIECPIRDCTCDKARDELVVESYGRGHAFFRVMGS